MTTPTPRLVASAPPSVTHPDAREVWVYLDVDGVLNAVHYARPSWGWTGPEAVISVNKFSIRVSTELVAAINALAAQPHVRMHWLTTWEDDAPNDLCPAIGLNGRDWPVLRRENRHEPTSMAWWKFHVIREHLPNGQRAIWIDDDLKSDRPAAEWLADNPNVTPVCPRTELGVTRRQMRLIAEAALPTHPERA